MQEVGMVIQMLTGIQTINQNELYAIHWMYIFTRRRCGYVPQIPQCEVDLRLDPVPVAFI